MLYFSWRMALSLIKERFMMMPFSTVLLMAVVVILFAVDSLRLPLEAYRTAQADRFSQRWFSREVEKLPKAPNIVS